MIKSPNKNYFLLILGLVLLFFNSVNSWVFNSNDVLELFNQTLTKKEHLVSEQLEKIISSDTVAKNFHQINHQFNIDGISFYGFENKQLKYWSNSTIAFKNLDEFKKEKGVVFLKDGFYQYLKKQQSNKTYLGLILIKKEYSIQNNYLKSGLHNSFGINDVVEITLDQSSTAHPIYDGEGNYMFSLTINSSTYQSSDWLSIIIFLLGVILLVLFLYRTAKQYKKTKKASSFITLLGVLLFYVVSVIFSIPEAIYHQKIFSPTIFGHSMILPSLGHFLMVSLTILMLTILWVKRSFSKNQNQLLKAVISMLVVAALNLNFSSWFMGLVNNSNINFDVNNLLDLTSYSFIGVLIIIVLFSTLTVLINSIIHDYTNFTIKKNQLLALFWLITLIAVLIGHMVFDINWKITSWMLFAIIVFSVSKTLKPKFYQSILLVLLIAATISYGFITLTKQKEQLNQEFLIKKLAKEADPVTEYLFNDLKNKIETDPLLIQQIDNYWDKKDDLDAYILEKYFTGYWNKYDVFLFLCLPQDTLVVQPENIEVSCFDFFAEKVEREAVLKFNVNDNIHFLYNKDGVGSYLGNVVLKTPDTLYSSPTLYIEMLPKLLSNNAGYPELLLNEKEIEVSASLTKYSFAKYKKSRLVHSSGDCNYSLELNQKIPFNQDGYFVQSLASYQHLYYQSDKNTVVVLSVLQKTNFNYITTFSYFFIFCSLFILVLGLMFNIEPFSWRIGFTDFSTKIQLFIIISTFLSFVLFGLGTSYYIKKQYEDKNIKSLQEKVQSVVAELNVELAEENSLTNLNPDFITSQLIKYSNVFYADINLYGVSGELLATSRPEIIERGLISNRMNPVAFDELNTHKKSSFIHEEHIGKMNYLSAYVPFRSNENKVVAYVNLPYFAKQNQLENELSQFFTALINIYALLFLVSIVIAVLFANYISEPVRLIKEKIRALQIGQSNEFIDWKSNDEIGSLVKEYNQKVLELEKSAKLLAQSERESAWREMAKQVAHEIKNPLTPMKLSIQHLERSIADNPSDLPERIKRTAKTLVEQIDTLTNIANEFSSFAKMPKAHEQEVNLVEVIETVIDLYKKEVVEITFNNACKTAPLLADKDQLNRIFNNLIKNAIQALPADRKGKIEVSLQAHKKHYEIKITDNGIGIPEEMQDKIFTPNFTTKTTGMGLGLAMVKNMVENLNGTIDFTTSTEGTIFRVEVPY